MEKSQHSNEAHYFLIILAGVASLILLSAIAYMKQMSTIPVLLAPFTIGLVLGYEVRRHHK